jgi:hypothetical protein
MFVTIGDGSIDLHQVIVSEACIRWRDPMRAPATPP